MLLADQQRQLNLLKSQQNLFPNGIRLTSATGGAFGVGDLGWFSSTGAALGEIYAYNSSGTQTIARLYAYNLSNSNHALINVAADPSSDVNNVASGQVFSAAGVSRPFTIMRGDNASTFLTHNGVAYKSISGQTGISFSATNTVSFTVTVPGASAGCQALATAKLVGLTPLVCNYVDNANGTVTIIASTISGASVTGSSAVNWLAWGT